MATFDDPTATIDRIDFGLLSPEEIIKYSVCQVEHTECYDGNKQPKFASIMDPRMGPPDKNVLCSTCKLDLTHCPGHFGHIVLSTPVCHVFYLTQIKKTLESICLSCGHVKICDPALRRKISSLRYAKEKFRTCWKICKTKMACEVETCGIETPSIQIKNGSFLVGKAPVRTLSPRQILDLFKKIPDEDLELLGYNSQYAHPSWMIITVLPVPPPSVRPSMQLHNGTTCIDDLASKLIEILRVNNQIVEARRDVLSRSLSILEESLMAHIATYFDNDCTSFPKSLQRQGRAIKSLKTRISGKTGRVRGSLMGKRVDFSARTVITGDPNIGVEEIGIPKEIAMTLTVPEIVTSYNIEMLQGAVYRGPKNHPGAIYVTDGESKRKRYIRNNIVLNPGDMVERHLKDGDIVLYNRQPTLSRYSMIAGKVRVLPGKTFRMHLSCTVPLNADFDGDEICMSVPQGIEASTELRLLCGVPQLLVSPQSNKPTMAIIQDSLIGIKRMTQRDTFVTRTQLSQLLMKLPKNFTAVVTPPAIMGKTPLWTGKQVFSMLLPKGLYYHGLFSAHDDENDPTGSFGDSRVVIENGELVSGIICKKSIGTSGGSLVHLIWVDYGPEAATTFIDCVQNVVTEWLQMTAFSVGVGDCLISSDKRKAIQDTVAETRIRCSEIAQEVDDPINREIETMRVLTRARDTSGKLATLGVRRGNGFVQMTQAGSKGSALNISQISGIVGQQCVEGTRIPFGIYGRTLPSFLPHDERPEARGFVAKSFLEGISPTDYFFHAMGGREGLIHTAVKSVTYDTRVILRNPQTSTLEAIEIGKWIDGLLDNEENKENIKYTPEEMHLEELGLENTMSVEMPTLDEYGTFSWGKVTAVTRHDPGKVLYKVTTKSGRSVTVTAANSLLIWDPEMMQFVPRGAPDVSVGDFCPSLFSATRHDTSPIYSTLAYQHGYHVGNCGDIPSNLYGRSTTFTRGFIAGYIQRVAKVTPRGIHVPVPEDVRECLAFLLAQHDMYCEYSSNGLVIPEELPKVVEDMVLDQIIEITEILPSKGQKMYDVTIPSTFNFILENGLGVRDTASTGYINRRLVKAMEDISVAYDGTVRTAEGLVVQFRYGHDGLDGVAIEKQDFPFFKTAVEELSKQKLERDQLLKDREILEKVFPSDTTKIQAPLCIPRIIDISKRMIPSGKAPSAQYIRDKVTTLNRTLYPNGGGPLLMQIMTRFYFASERVRKIGLTKDAFDWAIDETLRRFRKGLVSPGEAVGAVAAQSIGEPTTQFALDSFHSSGVTNELVCTGVGRLTELLNDTKKSRTPSMRIFLKDPSMGADKQTVERIASAIRFISLGHLTASLPTVQNTVPEVDQQWSTRFWDLYDKIVRPIKKSQYFLRIVLNKDCHYSPRFIAKKIENALGDCVICAYSPDCNMDKVLHVCIVDDDCESFIDYETFLNEVRVTLLESITINGTPEIERVTVTKLNEEYAIDTLGINLEYITSFPEIDTTRVYANDPKELKRFFGIDAARNCLLKEIRNVIEYDGTYVNIRHISLLCDVMCVRGFIMPITRHGINRIKTGALRRSTFEETLDVLTEAALNGETDLLKGVSENVMVGKKIPTGTGCMEIRYNDRSNMRPPLQERDWPVLAK